MSDTNRLNIECLAAHEIKRNYHNYLIEDMSNLFSGYPQQLNKADTQEIAKRVQFLEYNYQRIVGKVFGIDYSTSSGRLDMLLYPISEQRCLDLYQT